MLLRVLVWLKSDKERTKLKESFIESLCLTAYHYSVSINGDELFYVHSISSLYNNRNKLERATSKEYEIYAKHMKQFLIDLDGKQYVELDEILPCFKEAFKNVWRDFARCLD